MGLKIKLNRKNASDNFGILQVQYFNNNVNRYKNKNKSNTIRPLSDSDLKFKEISPEFMRDFQKFCFEVPNQYDIKMGINGWLNYLKVI